MKKEIKDIRTLKPGDVLIWRIPHMREKHGVGIVKELTHETNYSTWRGCNVTYTDVHILWSGEQRFFMNKEIRESMWVLED